MKLEDFSKLKVRIEEAYKKKNQNFLDLIIESEESNITILKLVKESQIKFFGNQIKNSIVYATYSKRIYDYVVLRLKDFLMIKEIRFIEKKDDLSFYTNSSMKFNSIIMNPPYDDNLHLKVVNECLNHIVDNGEIINLSPIRWLQDPLAEYKRDSDWKAFKRIRNQIEKLDVIQAQDALRLFGAAFTMNLGIYTINKNGGWTSFDKNNILTKIISSKSIGIPFTTYGKRTKKFFVLLKTVDGTSHVERGQLPDGNILRKEYHYGKWFEDGVSTNGKTLQQCKDDNKRCTNGNINNWRIVEFDTKSEIENFYNFTKTNLCRYVYLSECCGTSTPNCKYLPFMPTYTHPWTDEMLYDYYSLTEDEIKEIEETIK